MQNELTEQQKKTQVFGIHDNYEMTEPWNPTVAYEIAKSENIELTDEHIEVLGYLRRTFKKHGQIKHVRSLSQAMNTQFASKGGSKYLYTLFPEGPVSQGSKIAGIPAPGDSRNQSFGTSC